MNEIGQELVKKAADEAKKVALEKVIPSTAAIKIVVKVFKMIGFDLADDSNYSIMIDLNAKFMLLNDYYDCESKLKHKSSKNTESYRLSAIFFLQACEQLYKSANKLAEKHDVSSGYYSDRIKKIDTVLALYYVAAQSKYFDNFADIEKNIKNNKNEIQQSDIVDKATEISQDEAIEIVNAKQLNTINTNTFIAKLCSSQWYMINGYYYDGGPSDVVYSFTEDGYAIEQGLRGPATPSKFKYNIINDTCMNFSYDNNDFNYTIYQTESANVLRYKAKIYGDDSEGLLVKTEDKDENNSRRILNILAGGSWYSNYFDKKYSMNEVSAVGDGNFNTALKFGAFRESYDEGYTLYGNGITDYLALFLPSEYIDSDTFIFVEYNGEVDVNAYIFDKGEFIFEKWESYFSDGN